MTELNPVTGLIYLPEDLSQRLSQGLIRHNGRPFYVEGVNSFVKPNGNTGYLLYGMDTLSGETKEVRLPDEGLDVRPVPLGYVNGNKKAWYVSRIPSRRYKQSLTRTAIRVEGPTMSMSTSSFLLTRGFARCIMEDYPSFKSALSSVMRTKGQRAFCRRFALEYDTGLKEVYLCHRGARVGTVINEAPCLSSGNRYLQEELESVL